MSIDDDGDSGGWPMRLLMSDSAPDASFAQAAAFGGSGWVSRRGGQRFPAEIYLPVALAIHGTRMDVVYHFLVGSTLDDA